MRCIVTTVAALAFFAIHAKADDSQTDKFKACARDTAIAEIKQAQLRGEIPVPAAGEMFVAVEPYADKAYAACASLKPAGVTKPDGRPKGEDWRSKLRWRLPLLGIAEVTSSATALTLMSARGPTSRLGVLWAPRPLSG